jgi:hypothetical protein
MGSSTLPQGQGRVQAAASRPEEALPPGDASALLGGAVRLITSHPALLLEHLQAHASLLALEAAAAADRLKRQALWWAGAFFGLLAAAILAGAAVLLWQMRSLSATPAIEVAGQAWGIATPWLLASVPAVPLLLALLCVAGGLGAFGARVPTPPGPLARLQADLAGLQATQR